MSPEQFIKTAKRIYGHKHWKRDLARDLGVHHTTIHRIASPRGTDSSLVHRQIPGPYEVALLAMLQNHIRQLEINRAARSMLRQRRGKLMPLPKRKPHTPRPATASDEVERSGKPLGVDGESL